MKRILVVDDEPDYRMLVRAVLLAENYDVVLAANGEEALRKLGEGPIDMVITDIYMPVLDGVKLHQSIRSSEKFSHLPVLFVSGFDDQHTMQAVKDPRKDAFVKKGRPVELILDWVAFLLLPESERPKIPPGVLEPPVPQHRRVPRLGRH